MMVVGSQAGFRWPTTAIKPVPMLRSVRKSSSSRNRVEPPM